MPTPFDMWVVNFKLSRPEWRTTARMDLMELAFEAGYAAKRVRGIKRDGTPCKRCGGTVRYVANRGCVICAVGGT